MSTLENWAQDKLSVFLGFDSNTIRSQVWPYVMATKTPEAFCERLMVAWQIYKINLILVIKLSFS
jgi:hypothetical protein